MHDFIKRLPVIRHIRALLLGVRLAYRGSLWGCLTRDDLKMIPGGAAEVQEVDDVWNGKL